MLAGGLCSFLLLAGAPQAGAPIERIVADPTYQTTLPGGELPPASAPLRTAGPGDGPRRTGRPTPPSSPPPVQPGAPGEWALPLILKVLLGVVAVLAVAWWLAQLLGGRPSRARPAPPRPAPAPGARAEAPAEPIEALVRAGRFAEAIHQLLLAAFRSLFDGGRFDRALTSRELLAELSLAGEREAALAELALASEQCTFGGRRADRELFEQCRRNFELLAGAQGEAR